jgi:hypothetical protein
MKTKFLFIAGSIILVTFCLKGTINAKQSEKGLKDTLAIKYPQDVKAIVNNKCYQCHCAEAKSVKAEHKLDFDSLSMFSKTKRLSKLDDIMEVMEDGSMPPKKFIERVPSAKLTDLEMNTLKAWAKNTSAIIAKAN